MPKYLYVFQIELQDAIVFNVRLVRSVVTAAKETFHSNFLGKIWFKAQSAQVEKSAKLIGHEAV